ncbi:TPA: type III secretion system inner rod subunit SctI [Salmonella enterica]|nr:hypothetical protein [Salmonella enterica subsp. diarizonae]HEA0263522.1 type III secretion system inner rod subunit SctI [Salmonella enterica]HEA0268617.1 type III secretion system inner rod subunit SctI [Salmonella enterica]HEA0295554.1 type III secretion system inner rod subunit SctI [Salmonella enterica]HEA0304663.1 type III secretion system inner rod subunit SctI [Salmonella enterica]
MSISPLMGQVIAGPDNLTGSHQTSEVIPLEQRILNSVADTAFDVRNEKQMVLNEISQGDLLSDPQKLIFLQKEVSDATINVSLISALSRKATNTVETLLKS